MPPDERSAPPATVAGVIDPSSLIRASSSAPAVNATEPSTVPWHANEATDKGAPPDTVSVAPASTDTRRAAEGASEAMRRPNHFQLSQASIRWWV